LVRKLFGARQRRETVPNHGTIMPQIKKFG